MEYDAITLDTNIFTNNGYRLENDLLGQLAQFKQGSVQFVLSEIVLKEVLKHITNGYKEDWSKLEQAVKKASKHKLLSVGSTKAITDAISTESSPVEAAKLRLIKFIENTGAEVIPAGNIKTSDLIKMYFDTKPPFENKEEKKNEFPDAIALLSLSDWAKNNGKKILAVSNDKGWAEYAQFSSCIDVENDLASALEKFQKHVQQAEIFVASFLTGLDNGTALAFKQNVINIISDGVSSMGVSADAEAFCLVEAEQVYLFFQSFEFLKDGNEFDFTIVQIGADKIVAKVSIEIKAKAEAEFSFHVWDSVDKEYVGMGTNTAQTDVEFEAAILITLEADFSTPTPKIELSEVELLTTIDSIDFGTIELDRGDDWFEE